MYLLVRELTGNATAAFVAGLLFAFAPYRLPQSSHLQVLSSPVDAVRAVTGCTRYFDTAAAAAAGRRGAGAGILQNLSSGYYLLYFPPFAAAYVLWESGETPPLARSAHVAAARRRRGGVVAAATSPVSSAVCGDAHACGTRCGPRRRSRDSPPTSTRTRRRSASSGSGAAYFGRFRNLKATLSRARSAAAGARRRRMASTARHAAVDDHARADRPLAPRWFAWLLGATASRALVAARRRAGVAPHRLGSWLV